MRSSKWHALGNTYLLVEQAELTAASARELAVGTDGIVEILARGENWANVRIWNPDGTAAELSGNGTRMAARWLADETGARELRIRVDGGREVGARIGDDNEVETYLGQVTVGERERIDDVEFVPVSVGNPHAVVEGDPAEITRVGPLLETHPRFPNRTNVQVARVDAPGEVTARVWERGVGETSASGTSAVAIAAALHGDGETAVRFPGGTLAVRIVRGHAHLRGPAVRVD